MKHLKPLSRKPAQAADIGIGTILSVVAEILAVIGAALVTKETPTPLPGSGS